MDTFIKENGKMINQMEKVRKFGQMVLLILEIILMEKKKELGDFVGEWIKNLNKKEVK